MSTFRLATVNIHSFCNTLTYENVVDELVSILKPFDLDLIACQEIQKDGKWQKFCQNLLLTNFIDGQCQRDYFSNGIASRYPIQYYTNQETICFSNGGARSILQCRLNGDHPFVKDRIFAVTHLDHLNEDDRLKQINEFKPHKQNIDILMGDMNALTREDYTDNYYRDNIVQVRNKSRWEKPHFDLTKLITHQWDYQDAFKLMNPTLRDQEIATCVYGTRIDYIYVHPRVNDQWSLTKCSIIDTKGATDHNAVFAEFKQISND